MAITVHCDIVSAEAEIFSGLVEMVIAHGNLGDLGIAPGHAPLITDLKPGPIRLVKQGGEQHNYKRKNKKAYIKKKRTHNTKKRE